KTKIDKYCSVLVEECDKMNKLIQELLDYSRLDIFSATLLISTIGLVIFLEKNKINKEPAEKTIKPAMR
ncbi:Integral membrane sensor signal transduction histidine kinase, partial [human gut metagenome]